jgi:hypothetical protein
MGRTAIGGTGLTAAITGRFNSDLTDDPRPGGWTAYPYGSGYTQYFGVRQIELGMYRFAPRQRAREEAKRPIAALFRARQRAIRARR